MTITSIFGIISTVLAIYCTIPYIRSILAGRTKPHQLSWVIFVIMNGITLSAQLLAGARESALITAVFFVGSAVELGLSFKYGVRDTSRWDRLLFGLALGTIVIWALTRSNAVAIWLTLVIDVLAMSMLVLKIRAQPHTEDPYPWILACIAYVFSCLTLVGQPLSILYVRPWYGLLGDAAFVACIFFFRRRRARRLAHDTAPTAL